MDTTSPDTHGQYAASLQVSASGRRHRSAEYDPAFRNLLSDFVIAGVMLFVTGIAFGDKAPRTATDIGSLISTGECIQLAALEPDEPVTGKQSSVPDKTREQAASHERFRPMTEKELKLLLRALQPVVNKSGKGWALGLIAEPGEFDVRRIGVMMNDAVALLAQLQSEAVLGKVKASELADKETIAWMRAAYDAIQLCNKARYRQWGGDDAYQRALAIVRNNREVLEMMLADRLKRSAGRNREPVK